MEMSQHPSVNLLSSGPWPHSLAWAQRLAAACLFLLGCGGVVPHSLPEASAQGKEEKPVAIAGEEKFYEQDYLPKIEGQLYKLRKQEHDLKRKALEEAINQKLLSAEARKRGISEEELLREEADSKVAEPSESEVEEKFVAQLFRGGGQVNVTKDQIREQLKKSQVEQARQDFFRRLQAEAGVEILLPPPRAEVGYDPSKVRGNLDAPITIVEFSDFHCPFCLRSYTTMKTLLQKYEGKIKLAYRDLPLQEWEPADRGRRRPPAAPGSKASSGNITICSSRTRTTSVRPPSRSTPKTWNSISRSLRLV